MGWVIRLVTLSLFSQFESLSVRWEVPLVALLGAKRKKKLKYSTWGIINKGTEF